MEYRIETDSFGDIRVPDAKYYGASTQRAVENFRISKLRFSRRFVWAQAILKAEAARVNRDLGIVEPRIADAIAATAEDVARGEYDDHLVVDIFQTGSGTSSNMNMNEVVANLAMISLGGKLGQKTVHPNDHVNACQSSNDTVPTAMHIAAAAVIREELIPALDGLATALRRRSDEYDHVLKSARTHLMDAPPVTMGQVFGGYATQIEKSIARIERVWPDVTELPLGSTVNGTGINAHPEFATRVIARLSERTGFAFTEAPDHFEALGAKDAISSASGVLVSVALALFKIVNDIRWLASGPAGGIGELELAPLQPGSSIIPGFGKVNPVICEAVMQVVAQVVGNSQTVSWAVANGNFELNVMAPVMAHNFLESAEILAAAATALNEKTVATGMHVNEERCREILDRNVTVVTRLTPHFGYDAAADIVRDAVTSGRSVRDLVQDAFDLSPEAVDEILDMREMARGGRAS